MQGRQVFKILTGEFALLCESQSRGLSLVASSKTPPKTPLVNPSTVVFSEHFTILEDKPNVLQDSFIDVRLVF